MCAHWFSGRIKAATLKFYYPVNCLRNEVCQFITSTGKKLKSSQNKKRKTRNSLFSFFSSYKKRKKKKPRKSKRMQKNLGFGQRRFSPHLKCYSVLKLWLWKRQLLTQESSTGDPTWQIQPSLALGRVSTAWHSTPSLHHIHSPEPWWCELGKGGGNQLSELLHKCQHLFFCKN